MFQCRLCQKQCDGFHMAVSHLKHVHSLEDKEQAEQEQCPLCPKQFRKIDNLKVHVWRHVNRVIPGMADSKQKLYLIKRSQTKVLFYFSLHSLMPITVFLIVLFF